MYKNMSQNLFYSNFMFYLLQRFFVLILCFTFYNDGIVVVVDVFGGNDADGKKCCGQQTSLHDISHREFEKKIEKLIKFY